MARRPNGQASSRRSSRRERDGPASLAAESPSSPDRRKPTSQTEKRGQDSAPNADTAAFLLATAAALFSRKGYTETTTRELGEAIGIRGPSVYHYFRAKEDLLYRICRESLRRLTRQVKECEKIEDAAERLQAMIEVHVANVLHDRDMHTTMLVEMRSLTPRKRRAVLQRRDAYQRMIRDAIEFAQIEGKIRKDVPAQHLVLALLNMLNWSVFWYRPDGELAPEEIGRLFSTLYFEGVQTTA